MLVATPSVNDEPLYFDRLVENLDHNEARASSQIDIEFGWKNFNMNNPKICHELQKIIEISVTLTSQYLL